MSGCRAPWSNTRPRTSLRWKKGREGEKGRQRDGEGEVEGRKERGRGWEAKGERRGRARGRGERRERVGGGEGRRGRGKRRGRDNLICMLTQKACDLSSTNFDLWPCICVCFVHHLHDLHHVQINGFLGAPVDSQHRIHHHLLHTNTLISEGHVSLLYRSERPSGYSQDAPQQDPTEVLEGV